MSTFVATPVACPSGVVVKYAGAGATPADIIGVNAWMQLMPGPAEAAVSASGVAFAAEPVDVRSVQYIDVLARNPRHRYHTQ